MTRSARPWRPVHVLQQVISIYYVGCSQTLDFNFESYNSTLKLEMTGFSKLASELELIQG